MHSFTDVLGSASMCVRSRLVVAGLLATLLGAWPLKEAQAQEVSIPAAVALIGGGMAAAIGNGIRASRGLPPEDLWDDAGWFLGGLNLIVGTVFLVDAGVSTQPMWGALPIGIAITTIGVATLVTTAWVVAGAPDPEEDWLLTPALHGDEESGLAPGFSFIWRGF